MRNGPNLRLIVAALALGLGAAAAGAAADRSPAVQLHAGIFNVGENPNQLEGGVELRGPLRWWRLDVAGGVTASEEESLVGYVGLRRDFAAGDKWVVAPGFALAYYDEGNGKNLGGSFQFRSAIDLAYRITPRSRLGLTLYHLSNAGIENFNPGANSVVLTLSHDLD